MQINECLTNHCLQVRENGLTKAMITDSSSPEVRLTLLSIFFFDVEKGGFERLVYNANGVYLPELVDVLSAVGADETNAFLDRVINVCLDDVDQYNAFLEGDFSDCELKTKLHKLSEEYRQLEQRLEIEASSVLEKLIKQVM